MIRKTVTVAALMLVAACSKAPVDATAHYSVSGGQMTVTVKADAKGDLRFDAGPQTLIRKDGKDYVVLDDNGQKFAISIADFIGAQSDFMKASGAKPQPRTNDPEYDATKVGEETVADQKGDIWKLAPKTKGAAGETMQLVVSDDASLANLGKALKLQADLRSAGMKQLTGSESSVEKKLSEVMGKGMLLRMGDLLTLQDVAKGPVAASEFDLPKLIDKATILKKMTDAQAKALAAAKAQGAATAGGPPIAQGAPVAPAPSANPTSPK